MKFYILFLLLVAHSAYSSSSPSSSCEKSSEAIRAENQCTYIKTFKSKDITETPVLLVVLHGDSPRNNPDYQYKFAKEIADSASNLISIGMLRPGYADPELRQSSGNRGDMVGDNYSNDNVQQIGNAITALKAKYRASKVVVAGHSGGAAITAKVTALFPGIVDKALIVSCPCIINSWRKDMLELTKFNGFAGDIEVISPEQIAEKVKATTEVIVVAGKGDVVAKPYLSKEYVDRLLELGKNASFHYVEGGHEIFLSKDVIDMAVRAVHF